MTRLVAIEALPAGTVPGIDSDIPADAEFEVTAEAAEPLLKESKAKPAESASTKNSAPAKERKFSVRLLADGEHGLCNDVVELPASVVKSLTSAGLADADKDAVLYAMTLEQNKAKAKT